MGFIYNLVNMDSYKLLNCDFQGGHADKPHLICRMYQINVSNFCVFSHYPIGIMTKSFPVHVTCRRILLVKYFEPDINRRYLLSLKFAGFTGFSPKKGFKLLHRFYLPIAFVALQKKWNKV